MKFEKCGGMRRRSVMEDKCFTSCVNKVVFKSKV